MSTVPVSFVGISELATPERLVTDEDGVHTMVAAVPETRKLPDPLVGAPNVTVITVLGTPAMVTVAAVMVALNVVVFLFLMKLPLVLTEPRLTVLPGRWMSTVSPLIPVPSPYTLPSRSLSVTGSEDPCQPGVTDARLTCWL